MSMFETSHSCNILRKILSRSSALRLKAVIWASRCARSPAICLTKATAPVCSTMSWMFWSLA
jgi:hypothetical protein